jgi:hypothetical protein
MQKTPHMEFYDSTRCKKVRSRARARPATCSMVRSMCKKARGLRRGLGFAAWRGLFAGLLLIYNLLATDGGAV